MAFQLLFCGFHQFFFNYKDKLSIVVWFIISEY